MNGAFSSAVAQIDAFASAVAQIVNGQSFDQWHRSNIIEEDFMSALRPSINAALAKAGRKLTAAELYTLLGTSEPKKKVNATLYRMKTDGSIKAFSGDSPHKTLYALGGAKGQAHPAAHAPPKNGKGNGHDHTHAARPDAEASPKPGATPSAQCNVAQFVPAMTADKRLVMVGGSEPLIFSTEQTQSIADLIFENFEANT